MVLNLFSRSASKNRVRNERGAAMIEYALLAALLALALLTSMGVSRYWMNAKFDRIATAMEFGH